MILYPYIRPYKRGSRSARALGAALGIPVLTKPNLAHRENGLVINWGMSMVFHAFKVINNPYHTLKLSNKYLFAQLDFPRSIPFMRRGDLIPVHWDTLVLRHNLTGHSGGGIELVKRRDFTWEKYPNLRLLSHYMPERTEWRVHIGRSWYKDTEGCTQCQDNILTIQRKLKKKGVEVSNEVRNHQNGWIYSHNQGAEASEAVREAALQAFNAYGVDFAALDVIETPDGGVYVLEANTAPGLEGSTINAYVEYLQRRIAFAMEVE